MIVDFPYLQSMCDGLGKVDGFQFPLAYLFWVVMNVLSIPEQEGTTDTGVGHIVTNSDHGVFFRRHCPRSLDELHTLLLRSSRSCCGVAGGDAVHR